MTAILAYIILAVSIRHIIDFQIQRISYVIVSLNGLFNSTGEVAPVELPMTHSVV